MDVGRGRAIRMATTLAVGCLLLASCSGIAASPIPTVPPPVASVTAGWLGMGLTCGGPEIGMPEAVPSVRCAGSAEGVAVTAEVVGGNAGLLYVTLTAPAGTDPRSAAAAFAAVVRAGRPFEPQASVIAAWIADWEGTTAVTRTRLPGGPLLIAVRRPEDLAFSATVLTSVQETPAGTGG